MVDSKLKYFLIYLGLGFSFALSFSYLLDKFNALPGSGLLWGAGLCAAALLIVLIFQTFFIHSFYFSLGLVSLEAFGLIGFSVTPFSFWFVLAGLAFVLMWAVGFYLGKHEMDRALQINFWRYSMVTLGNFITGLALFIALLYAGIYARSGVVSYQAYNYVTPNFIPATNEMARQIQEKISTLTNTETVENETILDYTYRLSVQGIKYLQTNGLGFVIVAAIVMIGFFSIKGVMFFVKWPLLIIAHLIYLALLSLRVITIESEARQKEVAVIH